MKIFWALLVVLLLISNVRIATAADEDRNAEAVILFEEGVRAYQENSYDVALKAFRAAHDLRPNWKLLYNIAQCEVSLKHYGRALDAFEKYLVEGGDDIPVDRQAEVQREIERLQRLSGEVTISAPEGSIIRIDEFEAGSAPEFRP